MDYFMVKVGEDAAINVRIREVGHEGLIKQTVIIDDRGVLKQEYKVLPGANSKAVGYVLWGGSKLKKQFEWERDMGIYEFPKKACSLCSAQT